MKHAAMPVTSWAAGIVAVLVFALAYCSPVSAFNSDPAVALIASQALIDHQTLRLDSYRRSELVYDFDSDARVRSYNGAHYPNSLGVPILSVPGVWVANRMGLDMRDQRAEFATQNALSAVSCALLMLLLWRLCRVYLDALPSLVIATVSTLGTSAISTNATALWNSNYSLLFLSLALLHLARRDCGQIAALSLPYLAALLALGFVCRPSTGIFGLALLVYLLGERDRRIAAGAAAVLALGMLALLAPTVVPWPWMAGHYSPARLRPANPPTLGLYGVLLSPSRGLIVFSPFLGLVAAGGIRYIRSLRYDRLVRMCALWICLLTLAVATNQGRWWGGHSFGPRMLVDLVPGFTVLTCVLWRRLRSEPVRTRRLAAAAYLTLALAAVVIHTGQGLFNEATQRWNTSPDIDDDPSLAFDWRYPQFMATDRGVEARWNEYERREVERRRASLAPYSPGETVSFDSPEVVFVHWYPAEDEWRWSRGDAASLILRLPPLAPPERLYILEILAGSMGSQRVDVLLNGVSAGELALPGFDPVFRRLPVAASLLLSNAVNSIELKISQPSSLPDDPRQIGVSLRQLRLAPVAREPVEITWADDPFFGEGFSAAESGWRWTDGTSAQVAYPLGPVAPAGDYVLTIRARGLGEQRLALGINGVSIGGVVAGPELDSITQRFSGSLLHADKLNQIELELPDAATVPGDPRRLGLAVVSIRIAHAGGDLPS